MSLSNSAKFRVAGNATQVVSQKINWDILTKLEIFTADTTYKLTPAAGIAIGAALQTLPNKSRLVMAEPGTNLIVRVAYDKTLVTVTDPVIRVFGVDDNLRFHLLKNLSGSEQITIVTKATDDGDTDVRDSAYCYTAVTSSNIIDLQGSKYFFIVVDTAITGTVGDPELSFVEFKVI